MTEQTNTINFDAMPEIKRSKLFAATLKAVKETLASPGGREFLDQKIKAKKEAAETAKTNIRRETNEKTEKTAEIG